MFILLDMGKVSTTCSLVCKYLLSALVSEEYSKVEATMCGCDGIRQADSTQMREVHTQISIPSQILTKLKAKRFDRCRIRVCSVRKSRMSFC